MNCAMGDKENVVGDRRRISWQDGDVWEPCPRDVGWVWRPAVDTEASAVVAVSMSTLWLH